MKTLALISIVSSMACLQWQPSPTHHYSLYIDPNFSYDQVAGIMAAANDWETQSDRFITFDGAGVKGGQDTINIYADANIPKDCGNDVIGCEYSYGVDSDIHLPANLTDPFGFQQVAGHEIGHSIGFSFHIGNGNLMCSNKGCAGITVQCGDIRQLANFWNNEFDPDVLPICKGK